MIELKPVFMTNEFEYGKKSLLLAVLVISDYRHFDASITINAFSLESSTAIVTILIETLKEEMQQLATELEFL